MCDVCAIDQTQADQLCGASPVAPNACLPLTTNSDLCASPPGTISNDGFDDVCVLVECCNGQSNPTVEIPSGSLVTCSDVNCTSVCNLASMRNGGNEACNSICSSASMSPSGVRANCDRRLNRSCWRSWSSSATVGRVW